MDITPYERDMLKVDLFARIAQFEKLAEDHPKMGGTIRGAISIREAMIRRLDREIAGF